MKPIKFEGANVVFAADQPEYIPLPAQRVEGAEGMIITKWQLSEEELSQIAETKSLFVTVLTFNAPLQPLLLTINKPGDE